MEIGLNITGTLSLYIYDLHGKLLSDDLVSEVYDKLRLGIYLISLSSKSISLLEDFNNILYTFDFDVLDNTEYEFEVFD